ncbi:MAG: restriction endonuclease [Armatimonadetes bacterium]|nr:restriction endonuclease [Armatimonadota bacterium]
MEKQKLHRVDWSIYLNSPSPIKPADLMVFPEFVEFQGKGKSKSSKDNALPTDALPLVVDVDKIISNEVVSILYPNISLTQDEIPAIVDKATPIEVISVAYNKMRDTLAQEILEQIKAMSPNFFEGLIVQLMLAMGYGRDVENAGKTLGKSHDGGGDGVISQDKLGLDKIYLQAKRWNDTTVGSKEVQAFVGALAGQGVTKGVFITTSTFSDSALKYREKTPQFKISLIDGYELARLMIDHNLGVSLVQRFDVKGIDYDFFSQD